MSATITLNDRAMTQLAEALIPQIERLIEERMRASDPYGGQRLLRAKDVMALTGMSRSSLYRDQTFPKQRKIGERSVAWVEKEILAWVAVRENT